MYRTKRDNISIADTAVWTYRDEAAYRAEIERRYRERTPPRDVMDLSVRVGRSEMRVWATTTLGKLPPETEHDWIAALARWYRRMERRVEREVEQP